MAIQYAIEDGALVLRMTPEGFDSLLGALNAAIQDPRARPNMPLLIDVRVASAGGHSEDVRTRMQILPQIQGQLGPRWAVLVGVEPLPSGVARMFAFFTRAEGLEVGMFTDKGEALQWLRKAPGCSWDESWLRR